MNRKNKKLKGTVLFTVVSVMSILLIFLLSTLVLAASANKRSHKTYASTQTEYAARTAIESFFAAMEANDKIAEAVEKLDGTIYPTVNIDSKGFGDIFCYDNSTGAVLPNQIKVEKLSDEVQYVYTAADPGVKAGWSEYYPVRITANAQLGKEESSISAYIRKKAPNEPEEAMIKGLKTAHMSEFKVAGTITGGAGIGIGLDNPSETGFTLTNDPVFQTDLTYINGKLIGATNMKINVVKPNTGTVIMGNVTIANNSFINIEYDAKSIVSQQDVPYLYVDGVLSFTSLNGGDGDKCNIVAKDEQPFNVFCGSIENTGANNSTIDADVYLMDPTATSNIGALNNSTNLKKWSQSVATQTKQSFESKGGNIYSKGSVNLWAVNVDGDVRVEQNLQVTGQVDINGTPIGTPTDIQGDIVVGGKLIFDDSFINSHKSNDIYCASYEYVGTKVTDPPATGVITSELDELEFGGIKLKPISKYTNSNKIYPPEMEKEVINGKSDIDSSGNIVGKGEGESHKIIAQLSDVRKELHMLPSENENEPLYDPDIYHEDFPDGVIASNEYTSADIKNSSAVFTINSNTVIKEINKNCQMQLDIDTTKGNDVWIKLQNIDLDGGNLKIDINNGDKGGKVNFIIDGDVVVEQLQMTTSNIHDGVTIYEDTPIGIYWYGSKGSTFTIEGNGTGIGLVMAPYTVFTHLTNSYFSNVTYMQGVIKDAANAKQFTSTKPNWIGSALFKQVITKNSFTLFYSGAPSSENTISTSEGDYKVMYFDH